jgi:hypothetical protein
MISSVSGGIATELGGGKFANGARSAAFVSLFNRYGRIFFNPREAHNRATGNVDILGRNKQQQEREIAFIQVRSFTCASGALCLTELMPTLAPCLET